MNLESLLRRIGVSGNVKDTVITSVTENIDEVKNGSLFAAIKGRHTDGNMLIEKAFSMGAAAVLTEEDINAEGVIRVPDVRSALGIACSEFYGDPQKKMKIIGITGTNGKTTTAEYLRHFLQSGGYKTAVIGTLGSRRDDYISDTGYTTPSQTVLFRELHSHMTAGVTHLVMEVSSQALSQKRTECIDFSLAVLTNVGHDHLDYHGSMEEYVNAKKLLFGKSENSLINGDDIYCTDFINASKGAFRTYSADDRLADFSAKNIRFSDNVISYLFLSEKGICRFKYGGTGMTSVYNVLCAAACASLLGVPSQVIERAVGALPAVNGRMEKLTAGEIEIYIDFAHTPEALSAALSSLRENIKGKLICVFGCGGDRDKTKRSKMGKIASRFADRIVLTSDNPRNEDPLEIIRDIAKGINNRNIYIEPSREEAIKTAFEIAGKGDRILIAGKGHEEYQIIGNEKKFFSDRLAVRKIFGI